MRINNRAIRLLFFFLVFTFFSRQAKSQGGHYLGFALKKEKRSMTKVRNVVGLSMEEVLNAHNSLRMQRNYRTIIDKNLIIEIPNSVNFSVDERFFIKQKFLSASALYTYKTKLLNLTIGPSVDFYLGWNEEGHTSSS